MAFKITQKRTPPASATPRRRASTSRAASPAAARPRRTKRREPSSQERTRPVRDWLDVEAARLIVIHDAWSGMSERSPILVSYELRREDDDGFRGEARRSEAGRLRRVDEVRLAPAAAKRLLRDLGRAAARPGTYEPHIDHTDDFPRIEIAIHVHRDGHRDGLALLFSSSQGDLHAPWGACIGGELLTLPGDDVGRALRAVRAVVDDDAASVAIDTTDRRRPATASDWKIRLLPKARRQLPYRRSFNHAEWATLRLGLIPDDMSDRWFIYADRDSLWFHRSWTGYCLYQARIRDTANGGEIVEVWVNANPKQYQPGDDEAARLSSLIDHLLVEQKGYR